ncbi:U2 small nuclear ribonucleoprotein A' like protein, partial [Aduncisulcus paluster]
MQYFSSATEYVSCIGERTLILRDQGRTKIKSFHLLSSKYDCIDLNRNSISSLSGFPLMPRISSLFLADNNIFTISYYISIFMPSLKCLNLHNNRISNIDQLKPLFFCKKLEHLIIDENPITQHPKSPGDKTFCQDLRAKIIAGIPSLRFLNYLHISR